MNLLFLVIIVAGACFLFSNKRRVKTASVNNQNTQSAMQRLNERFVNGEIDEETFKKIKERIN